MSIPAFTTETFYDDALDALRTKVNGHTDGTVPIALPGIAGALNLAEGAVGARLAYDGADPRPARDAVEADWYSDPNDAIAAAKRVGDDGATVKFSAAAYSYDTDILLIPGLKLIAEGAQSTTIALADGASFKLASLDDACHGVEFDGFYVFSESASTIGIDARGLSHATFRNVWVAGFTDAGVWWGGTGTEGGWTNRWDGGRIIAPTTGAGMRFSGVNPATTANNITVSNVDILVQDDANSIGVDLQGGDTNVFIACDVGYSSDGGTAFKFGDEAQHNTIIASRTEDIVLSWVIAGGFANTAVSSIFDTITVSAPSSGNGMVGGSYDTLTDSSGEFWRHGYESRLLRSDYIAPSGSYYLTGQHDDEDFPRFSLGSTGQLIWRDGTDGSVIDQVSIQSAFWRTWGPAADMRLMIPAQTSLPTAQAALRGALVRVEGGAGVADNVYVCVKDAADAYVWDQVY